MMSSFISKSLLVLFLTLGLFAAFPLSVNAQPCTGTSCPTAIGPISTTPEGIADKVYKLGIGLGGALAFLAMAAGGIKLLTSGGNPEGIKTGWEMIGSAIAGLLFIVFAILILRTIGVSILGIPGFR